ncbi:hypothetical protein A2V49_02435 [candidate division WWE3 bacterium RBG_19FT_COMBO_34_6]|uniref:DUF3048 domain-containing protein n=1 Tax=candidate division WWE3 bacterium RBG_19FT_COMBO_34_6 TaxID=1802612 RepID=A0A1F4UJW2_UNCKA|nr:MAG: hypothetical protein A2V49_02435 [candidate division WWE3 bacterium RBG_19FT_COMBO_34_6]
MEQDTKFVVPPDQNMPHISSFHVEEPIKKKKPIIPIFIGVIAAAVIFSVIWFFILKKDFPKIMRKPSSVVTVDNKTQENLSFNSLTGELVPGESAKDWINTRPLAVMINNHIDARPQSGLISADLVYEIVAEGGITRYLSFFLSDTPEKIGPVRSTREYYLVLVKELGDAMLMHEGYSPQAKEAIDTWPVRSLFRGGAAAVANWRDETRDVAFEHTLYTDGKKLREYSISLGWEGKRDFQSWKFKDDTNKYSLMPQANKVSIDFWYEGDYSAIFTYNVVNNSYLRFLGYDVNGEPIAHFDNEQKDKQIEVKNLIIQFAAESTIDGDEKNRLIYELIGSGNALVFLDGKVIEATWTKADMDGRTLFYDKNGIEIEFNRGKVWICIVPDRNVEQVVYN